MEDIIQRITSEPILLGVAVVIGVIAILFLLKKLVKLAFTLILIAIVVLGFIYYTSDDPKSTIEKAIDEGQKKIEEVKDRAKEMSEDVDDLKDEVKNNLPGK